MTRSVLPRWVTAGLLLVALSAWPVAAQQDPDDGRGVEDAPTVQTIELDRSRRATTTEAPEAPSETAPAPAVRETPAQPAEDDDDGSGGGRWAAVLVTATMAILLVGLLARAAVTRD